MERIPCVVIGSGVVGLAITRALSKAGIRCLLLDKNTTFGSENSSRNSEVIHAGIYYPPNSLKSVLCLRGKRLLKEYIKERSIAYNNCGKLIVASTGEEDLILKNIFANASKVGVDGLSLVSKNEVKAMEPDVICTSAMLSTSTAIFDSHDYMLNLLADCETYGSYAIFNCTVNAVRSINDQSNKFIIETSHGSVSTEIVINSAGLNAVAMAQRISSSTSYPSSRIPKAVYMKGNYLKYNGKSPFSRLIYPVPVVGGLGIHATIDLSHSLRFGPDVELLVDHHEQDSIYGFNQYYDFSVNGTARTVDTFHRSIKKYWPSVERDKLAADYAGIRPKIKLNSQVIEDDDASRLLYSDFYIDIFPGGGVPNMVHLYGIESPGLTASMAIADYVQNAVTMDRPHH